MFPKLLTQHAHVHKYAYLFMCLFRLTVSLSELQRVIMILIKVNKICVTIKFCIIFVPRHFRPKVCLVSNTDNVTDYINLHYFLNLLPSISVMSSGCTSVY
jgi:hypothetical protein